MNRDAAIADFLARHSFAAARTLPLAQDASFRRYLRLVGGPRPAVLMDAPPPEDVRPFLRIAAHLAGLGLSAPEILAADPATGLVLEEDLGDSLFAALWGAGRMPFRTPPRCRPPVRARCSTTADRHACRAATRCRADRPAPLGPGAMAATTLDPLFAWWWPAAFGAPPPEAARADIADALAATLAPLEDAPKTFVHRDFFAGNLLWLAERAGPRRVGILDFQGAALGHPAYDLVSLVQDARRDLSPGLTEHAIARLLAARPELDPAAFRTAFAACAAQRHLRVATQWVRLAHRDRRPHYLVHGPHTWCLLATALRRPAAAPLAAALDRWVPVAMRGNPGEGKQGQGALPPGPPPGDSRPLDPFLLGFRAGGGMAAGRMAAGGQQCRQEQGVRALFLPGACCPPAAIRPAAIPPTRSEPMDAFQGRCPWRGSKGQRPLALLAFPRIPAHRHGTRRRARHQDAPAHRGDGEAAAAAGGAIVAGPCVGPAGGGGRRICWS